LCFFFAGSAFFVVVVVGVVAAAVRVELVCEAPPQPATATAAPRAAAVINTDLFITRKPPRSSFGLRVQEVPAL
jgi:hypothetical protein